jgi:trk system potassium uptake protein TrkH
MVAGGIPFVLYVRLLQGNRHGLRDSQVRTFLSLLLVVVIWRNGMACAVGALWL